MQKSLPDGRQENHKSKLKIIVVNNISAFKIFEFCIVALAIRKPNHCLLACGFGYSVAKPLPAGLWLCLSEGKPLPAGLSF
ncbi:MAG: hypothetical protein A3D27_02310 [Omnitrophica WOR_2 bacterium RIFCSPHIGHO2_02_FULL_46_37]|nr:MAG: hypothetical protein A3D27_02310 [Omnitrophica WOR_2 bacterium RIFCSPHIGHO2_02_FULL_46_37]